MNPSESTGSNQILPSLEKDPVSRNQTNFWFFIAVQRKVDPLLWKDCCIRVWSVAKSTSGHTSVEDLRLIHEQKWVDSRVSKKKHLFAFLSNLKVNDFMNELNDRDRVVRVIAEITYHTDTTLKGSETYTHTRFDIWPSKSVIFDFSGVTLERDPAQNTPFSRTGIRYLVYNTEKNDPVLFQKVGNILLESLNRYLIAQAAREENKNYNFAQDWDTEIVELSCKFLQIKSNQKAEQIELEKNGIVLLQNPKNDYRKATAKSNPKSFRNQVQLIEISESSSEKRKRLLRKKKIQKKSNRHN